MSRERSELRVGLLVIAALGVLGAALLLIGERKNLFVRNEHYEIRFQSVRGLKAGSPVQLNGVSVGEVEHIDLPTDMREEMLSVRVRVDRRYRQRIRQDSVARIKTIGLLGDKYIELSSGSPSAPEIAPEGEIPAAAATNVDALLASGEDLVTSVVATTHSLSEVLARMERGEGVLGELTRDQSPGRSLTVEAMDTLAAVRGAAEAVDKGQGPLPRLLHDRDLADRVDAAVARLDRLLADLEQGHGTLPALLHDEATRARVDRTLDNLDRASKNLADATGKLAGGGQAVLPRLLDDEAYGRELTEELKALISTLRRVADKLDHGDGTAARLINDPSVYEAVQDILVGIDQSPMLRWLVRNRQKAGIDKRYHETPGAPATPPPVPPPSPAPGRAPSGG